MGGGEATEGGSRGEAMRHEHGEGRLSRGPGREPAHMRRKAGQVFEREGMSRAGFRTRGASQIAKARCFRRVRAGCLLRPARDWTVQLSSCKEKNDRAERVSVATLPFRVPAPSCEPDSGTEHVCAVTSQERRRELVAKLVGWRGVGFVVSWTLLIALLMRLTTMQVGSLWRPALEVKPSR
eukprot:scaffold208362_cov24-Tisochrysis_lutea.AAC.1